MHIFQEPAARTAPATESLLPHQWFRLSAEQDADGGDAEVVETDDIVEAFDDDEAVLGDEFTVAGFLQAAGLWAEEFDASMLRAARTEGRVVE